jgi:hypothetical protein
LTEGKYATLIVTEFSLEDRVVLVGVSPISFDREVRRAHDVYVVAVG